MTAVYRLRVERTADAEDYPSAEDLGRLFAEAEELIGEGLPEGWYCKIEQTPEPKSEHEADMLAGTAGRLLKRARAAEARADEAEAALRESAASTYSPRSSA